MKNTEKMVALAKVIVDFDGIEHDYDNIYTIDGDEYLILDEDEREEAATEHIKESLWAFNASFLSNMTELPEEVFEALQDKCEGANEAIEKLIESTCGLEDFVEAAIEADGYGHFLAQYDGEEQETSVNGTYYYIYRQN